MADLNLTADVTSMRISSPEPEINGSNDIGNPESNENHRSYILELPEKVYDRILNYLSIWKLMDFRLTCQTTRRWVDESDHISKFFLTITSHKQMEEESFQKSTTPWSNIVIRCDSNINDPNWISNPLYGSLMDKLSDSITFLKLEDHRLPYSGFFTVLDTCKSLKRIEIGTLDCRDFSTTPVSFAAESLIISIGQLLKLGIGFLAWTTQDDLDCFKNLITLATRLEYLKAPHILMASLFQIGDTDDDEADRLYLELVQEKLINPILELMKARCTDRPCSSSNAKPSPLLYLDVENLHHTEIFPTIAATCVEVGTKLLNVSEAYEATLSNEENKYSETIESLNGFTQYLNFHRLINLKSIKLDGETSADSEIDFESIEAELKSLKSLTFCLPEDMSRNILQCFIKQKRPSVTSLTIEFQIEDILLFKLFKIPDLVSNFANLRDLALLEWNGKDDDLILIFKNLVQLQNLRLQGCSKITDRGFLGENPAEPVLLNLKDLKTLWTDCQISNAVLKYAVRHLHLESFYYSSDRITLVGFLALTQGPLTKTLIKLQVMQPHDCNSDVLQKFLSHFKNLKRGPIGLSGNCVISDV